ncbi:hypothetical protein EEL32_25480 [Brevibacillus laterosporus]|nr:hypothetical protein [Brevibacillus laterosporus]TPG74011.1 hypothetical protein EEL32_25480 [Brevibacillus laterosporus]
MEKQPAAEPTIKEVLERLKQALSAVYKLIFESLREALRNMSVPIIEQFFAEIENRKSQKRLYFRKKRSQAKRKAWRK